MQKVLVTAAMMFALFSSCKTKTNDLTDQLKTNLLSHLKKIDSTVVLDSFKVLRIETITRRMERTIDDSIYMREFVRVKTQLNSAIKEAKGDSIGFYQQEVDYMLTQVDSLNREISKADTANKLGLVATCRIQLGKPNRNQEGIVYYFLDRSMNVLDSELIDSMLSSLSRRLN
jgi:hypothetical protein